MKNIVIFSIFLVGVMSADWKRVIGVSNAPVPPDKKVMKSHTLGLLIRISMPGFNEQDTTVENKAFKLVEIPDEEMDRDTMNAGKPQIPYVRLLIAVPDSCEFSFIVNPRDGYAFSDYLLYPIPRIIFEDTNFCVCAKEVYAYDTLFYQKDTLWPGVFYEIISDGHWRDQRVLDIALYPIQFNPAQELMYLYTGFDFRIEYVGDQYVNPNGLGSFEEIGREILLNYPGIDRQPPPHEPPAVHYYTDLTDPHNIADYIIVTHYDFLNNKTTQKWIQHFAQWRVRL